MRRERGHYRRTSRVSTSAPGGWRCRRRKRVLASQRRIAAKIIGTPKNHVPVRVKTMPRAATNPARTSMRRVICRKRSTRFILGVANGREDQIAPMTLGCASARLCTPSSAGPVGRVGLDPRAVAALCARQVLRLSVAKLNVDARRRCRPVGADMAEFEHEVPTSHRRTAHRSRSRRQHELFIKCDHGRGRVVVPRNERDDGALIAVRARRQPLWALVVPATDSYSVPNVHASLCRTGRVDSGLRERP